jgi:hypothetical protein
MLKSTAFANALAIVGGLLYLVFYLIGLAAPSVFELVFNAQFLGADVASLIPAGFSLGDALVALLVVVITGWIGGYLLAWFYNRFAK